MKLSDRIKKLREKNKYVNGGFAFARALGRSKIGRNASSISFYIFISIIPLFILLCAQLPYTGISEAELQSAIVEITPDAVHELVVAVVKEAYTARRAIFSVSVVFLLWSSSKAMLAVIQSLDMVYCRKEKRSYFVMVAFSLLYTVTLLMLAGGALVLYSRGHNLEEMIAVSFPTKAMFQAWAKRGHNLIALLVITLFYSLIYRFAPSGKRKWRYQLPGAILPP